VRCAPERKQRSKKIKDRDIRKNLSELLSNRKFCEGDFSLLMKNSGPWEEPKSTSRKGHCEACTTGMQSIEIFGSENRGGGRIKEHPGEKGNGTRERQPAFSVFL